MSETQATIVQAIATKSCIAATYNRMRMILSPHVLYTRHGDLFMDAAVIEREGREFTELKLGTFKLIGLQSVEPDAKPFVPFPDFDAGDAKYQETTPFAIG